MRLVELLLISRSSRWKNSFSIWAWKCKWDGRAFFRVSLSLSHYSSTRRRRRLCDVPFSFLLFKMRSSARKLFGEKNCIRWIRKIKKKKSYFLLRSNWGLMYAKWYRCARWYRNNNYTRAHVFCSLSIYTISLACVCIKWYNNYSKHRRQRFLLLNSFNYPRRCARGPPATIFLAEKHTQTAAPLLLRKFLRWRSLSLCRLNSATAVVYSFLPPTPIFLFFIFNTLTLFFSLTLASKEWKEFPPGKRI